MSLLSIGSRASVWRGFEYYEEKKVLSWNQVSENAFEGEVAGSDHNIYQVKIDVTHPRNSKCNCPHAAGKRIICKHQIALFFTIFPEEAKSYIERIEALEGEEEAREQESYEVIVKYVNSLSKEALRRELINALVEAEERYIYRY